MACRSTIYFHLCLKLSAVNIRAYIPKLSLIVSVSICVHLIMNYGTILEQNCRGSANEMVISVFVRVCLIMNHGTIVQQYSRGSARDEFRCFCSHLFDYEPWNHIPQVIEGGMCDDQLRF